MSIFDKSTKVEVTLADTLNMATDITRLGAIAMLLEEKQACAWAKIIRDVADNISNFMDRIEEAFNEGEGS